MASVTRDFGTITDDSVTGTITWSNPGNAGASDNSYATAAMTNGAFSHYLKALNPQGTAVPTGATIDGIEIFIERKTSGFAVTDDRIRLVKAGTIMSTDRSAGDGWGLSDETESYGGATDLWNTTWTEAQVNASDFGVVLRITANASRTASVDRIYCTIYYTEVVSAAMAMMP